MLIVATIIGALAGRMVLNIVEALSPRQICFNEGAYIAMALIFGVLFNIIAR